MRTSLPIATTVLIGIVALLVSGLLFFGPVRRSQAWKATVTPLASIIGSGFLVIVPLLGANYGQYSIVAILIVVSLAYWIGHVIRFNIRHAEPLVLSKSGPAMLRAVELFSDLALSLAYFVSVGFYLRLLASFVLRGFGLEDELAARFITTVLIAFIAVFGLVRGLSALELLEEYSVTIKIAIIAALIAALAAFDAQRALGSTLFPAQGAFLFGFESVRVLAGTLIIVQGFETSRYMGEEYDAATRIRTMRWAQIASGIIYVVFVGLTLSLLPSLPAEVSETAIIDLSELVNPVLPVILVIAALMSQFSAAVADTIGAGGLVAESVGHRVGLTSRRGYALVGAVAVALVWSTNILEIVAIASRSFAFYYFLQAIVAVLASATLPGRSRRALNVVAFSLTAVLLMTVVIVAVPAG